MRPCNEIGTTPLYGIDQIIKSAYIDTNEDTHGSIRRILTSLACGNDRSFELWSLAYSRVSVTYIRVHINVVNDNTPRRFGASIRCVYNERFSVNRDENTYIAFYTYCCRRTILICSQVRITVQTDFTCLCIKTYKMCVCTYAQRYTGCHR